MSDNEKNNGYEVGYRKPPKDKQFKPGKSGNPKGRKKGRRSIQAVAREMLGETVEVKLNGLVRKITRAEMIVMRLMQDLMGDSSLARSRALKDLERYVPDFHLPAPEADTNNIRIVYVESDNYGRELKTTKEERAWLKEVLLKRGLLPGKWSII